MIPLICLVMLLPEGELCALLSLKYSSVFLPLEENLASLAPVVHSAEGRYAQKLLNDLMENYSRALRPVGDTDSALNVTLQITLSQIKDMRAYCYSPGSVFQSRLSAACPARQHHDPAGYKVSLAYQDERNQVLIAYLWIRQRWNDAYLKWNKEDYDGLEVIHIPSSLVWRPDLVLYNKADDDFSGPMDTNVKLRYNGEITWDAPAITKSSCVVDVSYFPFDSQECNLTFGSWTYNGNQVDIIMGMDSGDLSDFVENVEWECRGMPATKNVIMYGCCSDPYPDITYTVLLQRRSSFYIFNLLLPCFLISFLAPLGFYLPADSGEKVSLGVTVLLALTVFQLMVAESMPPSESVPLIGKYYIATMTMVTASTSLTIFIMNIHFCGPEAKPVPHWAKVLIIDYMSKIFFVYEVGENCASSASSSSSARIPQEAAHQKHLSSHVNRKPGAHRSQISRAPTQHHITRDDMNHLSGYKGSNGKIPSGDFSALRLWTTSWCATLNILPTVSGSRGPTCAKVAEWKKVAKVMDRFFMWLFFIMVFLMSILVIGKA
ncbi:unnamed protein product, partial [Tetraodon nigroviridis]